MSKIKNPLLEQRVWVLLKIYNTIINDSMHLVNKKGATTSE